MNYAPSEVSMTPTKHALLATYYRLNGLSMLVRRKQRIQVFHSFETKWCKRNMIWLPEGREVMCLAFAFSKERRREWPLPTVADSIDVIPKRKVYKKKPSSQVKMAPVTKPPPSFILLSIGSASDVHTIKFRTLAISTVCVWIQDSVVQRAFIVFSIKLPLSLKKAILWKLYRHFWRRFSEPLFSKLSVRSMPCHQMRDPEIPMRSSTCTLAISGGWVVGQNSILCGPILALSRTRTGWWFPCHFCLLL